MLPCEKSDKIDKIDEIYDDVKEIKEIVTTNDKGLAVLNAKFYMLMIAVGALWGVYLNFLK